MNEMSLSDLHAALGRAFGIPETVDAICRLGGWINPFEDVHPERLRGNDQQVQRRIDMGPNNLRTQQDWVKQPEEEERSSGVTAEIDRCRREIATIEAQIRFGHPDLLGLCRSLLDWNAELRFLENGGMINGTS